MSNQPKTKIVVAQLGARMHYAVPRIFNEATLLTRLYTDICFTDAEHKHISNLSSRIPIRPLRKLFDRVPRGIPAHKICRSALLGLRYDWGKRKAQSNTRHEAQVHIRAGFHLGRSVSESDLDEANLVYGFNSASEELFRRAKKHGCQTVYEQTIAPVALHRRLLEEEYAYWPAWEDHDCCDDFFDAFEELESREKQQADMIVCGSDFVRDAVAKELPSHTRVLTVPYGTPPKGRVPHKFPPTKRKLRVLTVGSVGLRKGAPYIAEASERLSKEAEFRWAGPLGLSEEGTNKITKSVALLGTVPRSQIAELYDWADVMLLPSICEGSATVTYEAAQMGVPVVVTPNSGAPFSPDSQVFIPIRDVDSIVSKLRRLHQDTKHYEEAASEARSTSEMLTVEAYGKRLVAATSRLLQET